MFAKAVAYLKAMATRRRAERELGEELQFHVDMETQANVERGMTQAEARRVALRDLAGLEQTREAVRDQRATPLGLGVTWRTLRVPCGVPPVSPQPSSRRSPSASVAPRSCSASSTPSSSAACHTPIPNASSSSIPRPSTGPHTSACAPKAWSVTSARGAVTTRSGATLTECSSRFKRAGSTPSFSVLPANIAMPLSLRCDLLEIQRLAGRHPYHTREHPVVLSGTKKQAQNMAGKGQRHPEGRRSRL